MSQDLLIVFATQAEAAATLRECQSSEEIAGHLYRFDLGSIAICGIGCLAAATTVARYGTHFRCILNLGIAGSLRDDHAFGQVLTISSVARNNLLPDEIDDHSKSMHATHFSPLELHGDEGLRLVSSDYPIHHPYISRKLAANHDLVDMEGYGIAYASQQLSVPCFIWKAVSDFTNANGPAMIREQIDALSDILADSMMQTWSQERT